MKIEGLRLKNYKIFKDLKLTDLPDMVVFLGANGSGKSTLFDAFGFLHDSLIDNVGPRKQNVADLRRLFRGDKKDDRI